MTFIVYKLTSPSGKSYVGFTRTALSARMSGHRNNWNRWKNGRSRSGACTKLFYAFDKYPIDTWVKEVLFESSDEAEAFRAEQLFIETLDTVNNGYNLSRGGEGGATGLHRTQKDKDAKSAARKAYYQTDAGKAWKLVLAEKTRMKNAKVWIIVDPDGMVHEIENIMTFARERGHPAKGFATCMRQRGSWKGYTGKKKAPDESGALNL